VENQAECLKFWKKNSRAPAGTLSNSVGEVENQAECFKFGKKKFKGSRRHLAKFSWGGGKSGRVF